MRLLKKPLAFLTKSSKDCPHDAWTCNRCGTIIVLKEMDKKERRKSVKQAKEIIDEANKLRDVAELDI